jgi:protein-glutamine gamma-glutamyltransferase
LTFDSLPAEDDWRVDDDLEPVVAQIANELQLTTNMPPREALQRVSSYFQDKFQYAAYLGSEHRATSNETALARFLLRTRAGHCEYFATATTLLLRKAGLPTRYAVGYSVQEGSGRKYIVRDRHAHAWTLVYHDNAWRDFDTTPASWNTVESAHGSWLQPIKDFFSDAWFQFSKFRWSKTEWRKFFMWAPAPLLLIVLARFFLGKQWKKMRAQRQEQAKARVRQGIDSDFYLVEKHFAARGLERGASESWSDWLRRVSEHESSAAQLHRVLLLHQRHRFDPHGLTTDERAELHREVGAWMIRAASEIRGQRPVT